VANTISSTTPTITTTTSATTTEPIAAPLLSSLEMLCASRLSGRGPKRLTSSAWLKLVVPWPGSVTFRTSKRPVRLSHTIWATSAGRCGRGTLLGADPTLTFTTAGPLEVLKWIDEFE
jgi:hypothetical protein